MAAKPGPKPLLDDAKKGEIVGLLKAAFSEKEAFRIVGVSRQTVKRSAKADPAFAEQIKTATDQGEHEVVKVILEAAKRQWQAGAWWLERKHWQKYAKRKPDAYTPEQFMLFASRLAELTRRHLPADRRQAYDADLDRLLKEMAKESETRRE